MTTTQTEQWSEFSAHNSEKLYGFGTAEEVDRYADALNSGKEINLYGAYPLTNQQVAELKLEERTDAFSLEHELRARSES